MNRKITKILENVTEEFLKDCRSDNVYEINTGLCGDYVDYAVKVLSKETETASALALNELDLMEEYRHLIEPPPGLTWDEFDTLSLGDALGHSWIIFEDRHYDAEHPEGVSSPFDLRTFRTAMVEYLAINNIQVLKGLLQDSWWKESQNQCGDFLRWNEKNLGRSREHNAEIYSP